MATNFLDTESNSHVLNKLVKAAKFAMWNEVWEILDQHPCYVNVIPSGIAWSVLHQACFWNDLEAVRKLLSYPNCDPTIRTRVTQHECFNVGKEPRDLTDNPDIIALLEQTAIERDNYFDCEFPTYVIHEDCEYKRHYFPLMLTIVSSTCKNRLPFLRSNTTPYELFTRLLSEFSLSKTNLDYRQLPTQNDSFLKPLHELFQGLGIQISPLQDVAAIKNIKLQVALSIQPYFPRFANYIMTGDLDLDFTKNDYSTFEQADTDDKLFRRLIYLYTLEKPSIFSMVNKTLLRTGNPTYQFSAKDLALGPYSLLLASVVFCWDKLPRYSKPAYRSIFIEIKDRQKYTVGKKLIWLNFVSCTKAKSSSRDYGDTSFRIQNNVKSLWQPREIAQFSEFPDEHEILYPPGTEFQVTDMLKNVDGSIKTISMTLIESV